jgi:hypothetical protein
MWQPRGDTRGGISLTVAAPKPPRWGQLKIASSRGRRSLFGFSCMSLGSLRIVHHSTIRDAAGNFPALLSFIGPCREPATRSDDGLSGLACGLGWVRSLVCRAASGRRRHALAQARGICFYGTKGGIDDSLINKLSTDGTSVRLESRPFIS